jgi:hypothetical protein
VFTALTYGLPDALAAHVVFVPRTAAPAEVCSAKELSSPRE